MSLVQIVGSKIKFAKADLYDSSKKTDKLTMPIFGSHGQSDEVIDMKFSKKTVSKFPNVWKFLELDCGHHDIDYSDDLMDELISFLDFVGKNIDAPSLIEFGAKHLAKYKAPKIIHFMEDFPRTKNGKILRNQLVTMIGSAE